MEFKKIKRHYILLFVNNKSRVASLKIKTERVKKYVFFVVTLEIRIISSFDYINKSHNIVIIVIYIFMR